MQIEIPFETVRVRAQELATDVNRVLKDNRIVFGPGHPSHRHELTSVYLNPQQLEDVQAFGQGEPDAAV